MLCLINDNCFAESQVAEEKLSSAIEEIINGLDLTELEKAYSDIEMFSDIDLRSKVTEYLGGQTEFGPGEITEMVIRSVVGSVSQYLPEILAVLCVAIFGCILDSIRISSLDTGINEIGFFVVNALVISLVASLFFSVYNVAKDTVALMTGQIQAVFPIILTLMSASGASATAAAMSPSVAYVCTFESVIAEKVLFPVVVILFLFGAVGSLSKSVKVGRMNDFFKSVFKWITGASGLAFSFFISAQGITASTFDGFSLKALKYVVGNGFPVVSQFVNGGFDIVFASCVLVKNSLGVLALVAMLITVLLPVVKIVVLALFLRFCAAAIEPVSDERTVKFITVSADALNYLAATVISVSVVYLITIFISVCSLGVSI